MGEFRFEEGTVQPAYRSHCISNIAATLLPVLGLDIGGARLPDDVLEGVDTTGVQNVVLFVFDGLGYREWQRQTRAGLFGGMASKGRTTPITSVFPSTTSAALTSITTGLTPLEHTLIEWFLYVKELDMVIQSLPFSPMGERRGDLLLPLLSPKILLTGEPIFARMAREGVAARSYLNRYIAHSAYSGLIHGQSEVLPYAGRSDMVANLRSKLESETGPSFHYVYWSSIDTAQHNHGPGSVQAYAEAANISGEIGLNLVAKLERSTASKTLFAVTADHGHVYSPTDETTWLNRYRSLTGNLALGPGGGPVPPWGAPRDVYLRIRDEKLAEVESNLSGRLSATATVARSADVVASGVFGPGVPSERFLERVGNLMILPVNERSVWYRHPGVDDLSLKGQHGGMHPDEMTVPFSIARASSLSG